MEIVVLIKPVPDAETRLRTNAAGTGLDPEGVKFVLAGYDESAVEQALLLKESQPGSAVRAMSFGPATRAEEVLRAAIALGCDHATLVEAPAGPDVEPLLTARSLAMGLGRYPHPLILTGKQAGDDESGIVPSAVAELLGIADYGSVLDLRWDTSKELLTFHRAVEGGALAVEAPLPAVISLQQAWNDPRTAKLPMILKSRKAPIDRIRWKEVSDLLGAQAHAKVRPAAFRLPPPRSGAKMVEFKDPQEAAEKLVRILTEEAKVFP